MSLTRLATPIRSVATSVATVLLLMVAAALFAASCGSNPNEHLQSNEFFRPSPAQSEDQVSTAESGADQQQQTEDQSVEAQQEAEQAESEDAQAEQSDSDESQDDSGDADDESADADQQDSSEDDAGDSADDDDDAAPLETSDDVVRRYSNPSYGYSFELICSPFCDPNSNGTDRVSFLSETGRALIGVDVTIDDGSDVEELLRSGLGLDDNVEFSEVSSVTLVTGEPAERFDWEEDRRATGGFQVRWHAILVRVQGIAIILRAGAVLEDYESVSEVLERAMSSFILPLEVSARPGRYDRFEFAIDYDPIDVPQEFGQPTSNPPNFESGIFVLQTTKSLRAVLTWQVLGEAFFDGDTAIRQSLADSLGVENVSNLRDWGQVDGRDSRTGETETQFGEGLIQIQSFAWYCRDGGREFALHVLDPDDPETVALPLLESFRCNTESAAETDAE